MNETKVNMLNNIDYSVYDNFLPFKMRNGKLSSDYQDFIESIDIEIENTYNIEYLSNLMDLLVGLSVLNDKKSISGNIFSELTNKGRLKLTRGVDLINSFEFIEYPNETVESITLFLSIHSPKDPIKKELWLNDKLEKDDNCFFFSKECDVIYYPLKRIENVKGKFNFYNKPLPMFLFDFSSFSLEVKLKSEIGDNYKRFIKVNSTMFDAKSRKTFRDQYIHEYNNMISFKKKVLGKDAKLIL